MGMKGERVVCDFYVRLFVCEFGVCMWGKGVNDKG